MADKIKYLGTEGLRAVIGKIKRLTTGVYTIKGRAIYADSAYLADPNKEQDIDSVGIWRNISGVWTKVTAFTEGDVYDIVNAFTTTIDFIEGANKVVPASTNIVVVNVGNAQTPVLKFDLFSGVLSLDEHQTKKLVTVLEMYSNETPAVYTDAASLPDSETLVTATITDGMIAVIGGTSSERGDVYKATVTIDTTDNTLNNITWKKLGNQETVEGALKLLSNVCPNTPITSAEIDAMFL